MARRQELEPMSMAAKVGMGALSGCEIRLKTRYMVEIELV
jgi:hypothetical protein